MAEETKDKIDTATAKAGSALDEVTGKAKAVLADVKANFKADEGTTGVRKVSSYFANLWKSGTTGKSVLIAGAVGCVVVTLLLAMCLFGGGRISKVAHLHHELYETNVEICELNDYLGHRLSSEQLALESLLCPPTCNGRLLKEGKFFKDKSEEKACRELSSKDFSAVMQMFEKVLAQKKDDLKKLKDECKERKIEIDRTSPLRVAKQVALCLQAQDQKGLKKLFSGDDEEAAKKAAITGLCQMFRAKDDLMDMTCLGPTFFNKARDVAAVAIQKKNGKVARTITGDPNPECLRLIKTKDGWLVASNHPWDKKNSIIPNPLLDFSD